MINVLKEKWQSIIERFVSECELSDLSYQIWIKPLVITSVENNTITLSTPDNELAAKYVNTKYKKPLRFFINEALDGDYELVINYSLNQPVVSEPAAHKAAASIVNGVNPNYTFYNFVVGDHNNMAHAASLAVAESPADIYNPLFIYGGSGLGKTHLMHAIANFITKNNSNAKILYVTSEKFINEVVEMIRSGNSTAKSAFHDKYRTVDVFLIDDIQFIIGKESSQIEFFNTFNFLYEQKKQIIISSDKPPKDMETLEERIQSRFLSGITVDIQRPTYETRVAILRKKAEQEDINVEDEVINYIAANIKTNIRELEGALKKIKLYSRLSNEPVNVECAEKVLKDFISSSETEVTAKNIISVVAEHFGISLEDMASKKKNRDIAYPRQIAMYLCRMLTDNSYDGIGELLGGKDHSTVKHGCDKIQADVESNETTNSTIEVLKKKILPS